jgi:hypothetical protein
VFSFPVIRDSEWIAVDLRRASYLDRRSAPSTAAIPLARLVASGDWETVLDEDGIFVLRRTAASSTP